ncbi:MAG TPA: hypothetical protein VIN03_10225 [Roseateles sp.]
MTSNRNSKPTTAVSATPDPETQPTLWWSHRPVPKRHKRLRTGEPVDLELFNAVVAGVRDAIKELKPGHPYKTKHFIGLHVWEDTSVGYHRRAGRVLADIARNPTSPIGLIERPRGGGHRYFVRPESPAAPVDAGNQP